MSFFSGLKHIVKSIFDSGVTVSPSDGLLPVSFDIPFGYADSPLSDPIGNGTNPMYTVGGTGSDKLVGSKVNDTLLGGEGSDKIYGGNGDDTIFGGTGIYSPIDGDDLLKGGNGNDFLYGNGGNDLIFGDSGNDHIFGGDGADFIYGGSGTDAMTGGSGADVFVFNAVSESPASAPGKTEVIDVITDFNQSQGDKLELNFDAKEGSKHFDHFKFIGNFYDVPISLHPGEVAAQHIGQNTYIQGLTASDSRPSIRIELSNFYGAVSAGDFLG